jgi:hypothetical protein
VFGDGGQEERAAMAIAGAMVGGQGGGHDGSHAEEAVDRPGTLDDAAEAHERNLLWKDHAVDRSPCSPRLVRVKLGSPSSRPRNLPAFARVATSRSRWLSSLRYSWPAVSIDGVIRPPNRSEIEDPEAHARPWPELTVDEVTVHVRVRRRRECGRLQQQRHGQDRSAVGTAALLSQATLRRLEIDRRREVVMRNFALGPGDEGADRLAHGGLPIHDFGRGS